MQPLRLAVISLFIFCSFYALAQCTLNPAAPSVTICSPANGATVSSPVSVVAGTTSSQPITLLQIYLDGLKVYQVAGGTLNASVAVGSGTHRLTVQARDSAGAIFRSWSRLTPSAATYRTSGWTIPPSCALSSGTLGFRA